MVFYRSCCRSEKVWTEEGRQVIFVGHDVHTYLSKYTIEPDSRVPFFYGMPFSKYIIVFDTKKSLETDIRARIFDSDKSVPHFTSFQN